MGRVLIMLGVKSSATSFVLLNIGLFKQHAVVAKARSGLIIPGRVPHSVVTAAPFLLRLLLLCELENLMKLVV